MRRFSRILLVPLVVLACAWLAAAASSRPTLSIEIWPPNPAAGQAVRLAEGSGQPVAGAGAWLWDFGDGHASEAAAPSHRWEPPGRFTVRLTSDGTTLERDLVVSPADTLRLDSDHPFEFQLETYDPKTGVAAAGRAVAQTDAYGWFLPPGTASDAGSPALTVQVAES